MSWLCSNCSSSNTEKETSCFVCGAERKSKSSKSKPPKPEPVTATEEEPAASAVLKTDERKSVFGSLREKLDKWFGTEDKTETKATEAPEVKPAEPAVKRETSRTRSRSTFASPWPEHNIVFDKDMIKAKGYVGVEQKTMDGYRGYRFCKADGTSRFMRVEMVIVQKMARKV